MHEEYSFVLWIAIGASLVEISGDGGRLDALWNSPQRGHIERTLRRRPLPGTLPLLPSVDGLYGVR